MQNNHLVYTYSRDCSYLTIFYWYISQKINRNDIQIAVWPKINGQKTRKWAVLKMNSRTKVKCLCISGRCRAKLDKWRSRPDQSFLVWPRPAFAQFYRIGRWTIFGQFVRYSATFVIHRK